MKKIRIAITLICVTGLSLVFAIPVLAQTTQNGSLVQAVKIPPERAEGIALARVGNGIVMDIELERKYGQAVYEVEIIHNGRKYEVKIDATTSEIIKLEDDNLERSSARFQTQNASLIQEAKITFARAEEITLERVGGGAVTKIELKRKRQRIIYEVETIHNGREYEIKIDAATGKIIKLKSELKR